MWCRWRGEIGGRSRASRAVRDEGKNLLPQCLAGRRDAQAGLALD